MGGECTMYVPIVEAGTVTTVATLYDDVQQRMRTTKPAVTWFFKHAFQSLEETLASMQPMVLGIDQSDQKFTQKLTGLLEVLIHRLKVFGLKAWFDQQYKEELKVINDELNGVLEEYVLQCLYNTGLEVQEDDPANKMNDLIETIEREQHRATAESMKLVFEILDLTLAALHKQMTGGELVYTDRRLLPSLKTVEVLLKFRRGKYGIDIPGFLKKEALQLRSLLPGQVQQPLDLQIQGS